MNCWYDDIIPGSVINLPTCLNACSNEMKKNGFIRKFNFPIYSRLSNRLRGMGFNGRFKDATSLIDAFNLPDHRPIEGRKVCTISRIQARVTNPRMKDGFTFKPSITVRFLIKCVFD